MDHDRSVAELSVGIRCAIGLRSWPHSSRRWLQPNSAAALGDALAQAEQQVKELTADVARMESAKGHAFTPPPRAWIAGRIAKLNELLAQRTEQSALALRRLTGAVTLTPEKPDVGRGALQV